MKANDATYKRATRAVTTCHQNCERSSYSDRPTATSRSLTFDTPVPTLAILSSSPGLKDYLLVTITEAIITDK
jgi:hypothetical protein